MIVQSDSIRIALVIGSTRAHRAADIPARWVVSSASQRTDLTIEVLDLRDYPLPFLGEPDPRSNTREVGSTSVADSWRKAVDSFDGYIVTAAEYNHGPAAVLKNALDYARSEWSRKPIGFVGYGGVGGARAVEQLRQIAVELQMAPVKAAVHIGGEVFANLLKRDRTLDSYEHLNQALSSLFDQMVWWASALKAARTTSLAVA